MKENMTTKGYSAEEEYFYKRNQELIEKNRKLRDAERTEQAGRQEKGAHWMRCPKCGGQMEETDMAHILVERCTQCQGIFFDHGELETLLASQEPKGFLDALKGLFS